MGDLVMSSLLPASDAEGDAFYDSPRDGGWEQVIKPFFQTISDGIRNQSWCPELEELLGVGRPTRSERFRNRLGGKIESHLIRFSDSNLSPQTSSFLKRS